jgi:hypothetical protein
MSKQNCRPTYLTSLTRKPCHVASHNTSLHPYLHYAFSFILNICDSWVSQEVCQVYLRSISKGLSVLDRSEFNANYVFLLAGPRLQDLSLSWTTTRNRVQNGLRPETIPRRQHRALPLYQRPLFALAKISTHRVTRSTPSTVSSLTARIPIPNISTLYLKKACRYTRLA